MFQIVPVLECVEWLRFVHTTSLSVAALSALFFLFARWERPFKHFWKLFLLAKLARFCSNNNGLHIFYHGQRRESCQGCNLSETVARTRAGLGPPRAAQRWDDTWQKYRLLQDRSVSHQLCSLSFAVYSLNFTERNKLAAHASESASQLPLKLVEFSAYSWIFSIPYPAFHVLKFCNKEKLPPLASATFN